MLERVYGDLARLMKERKVLIIYGARQVGKTTILEHFLKASSFRYKLDTGDNIRIQHLLNSKDLPKLLDYISGYELIAIDEAQEIENIGHALKIMIDHSPETKIIVTGSSSFDLAQKIGEPLTGRKTTVVLYPVAQKELIKKFNRFELNEKLEEFLLFGSYPEVLLTKGKSEKIKLLHELADSYLLRDILKLETIKSPKALYNLIKLLAFQIGNEVSLNEVSSQIMVDVKTVSRYIDLLEKSFVIKRLGGFGRNLRKEVTSKCKYYFMDTGIRNAVISQFNPLEDRSDRGALFENFVMMERIKKNAYEDIYGAMYFWRTYDGQEIDLIEELDGNLSAFEFKFSPRRKVKSPKAWITNYKNAEYKIIHSENYLDFVL